MQIPYEFGGIHSGGRFISWSSLPVDFCENKVEMNCGDSINVDFSVYVCDRFTNQINVLRLRWHVEYIPGDWLKFRGLTNQFGTRIVGHCLPRLRT